MHTSTRPRPYPETPGRRQRRRRSAMTLVELMIVVVLLGVIGTSVTLYALKNAEDAKKTATRNDVNAIRGGATLYISDHGGCPTVQDLIEERILDPKMRTTDAWDHEFQIECDGLDINVTSSGPDGQFGTEDDIE